VSQRRGTGGARREASERITVTSGERSVQGWTLNVSRGGVRVVLEEPVEPGQEYTLAIGDDSDQQTRRGRVVWVQNESDGQIAGIEFVDAETSSSSGPSV
jgi:hypothetical protein